MGQMKNWKVKDSKYLIERPWLKLREDHVILPNGNEIDEFHVAEYPNWASIVCLDENNNLVLVEQYRHGVSRLSLELAGGVIEEGQEPQEAAERELLEETGYASEHWRFIGKCATDPSNHSNYAYLFFADRAYLQGAQQLDAEEEIAVHTYPLSEIKNMIEAGEIIHGIHLTAIMWAGFKGWLPGF